MQYVLDVSSALICARLEEITPVELPMGHQDKDRGRRVGKTHVSLNVLHEGSVACNSSLSNCRLSE